MAVLGDVDAASDVAGRSAGTTLVDLQATELQIPRPTPFGTGFHPLDEVLNGGIRAGDLLVIGGKPGQGKTIAALQWARHMARTGPPRSSRATSTTRSLCLTRLLACELGEAIAASRNPDEIRLDELRDGLRAVSTGTAAVRAVLDSDPLLKEAEERLEAYADNLILVRASGTRTDVAGAGPAGRASIAATAPPCSSTTCRRCR